MLFLHKEEEIAQDVKKERNKKAGEKTETQCTHATPLKLTSRERHEIKTTTTTQTKICGFVNKKRGEKRSQWSQDGDVPLESGKRNTKNKKKVAP